MKPADALVIRIRQGLTLDDFDDLILDDKTSLGVFSEALRNYDVYAKMIDRMALKVVKRS